MQLKDKTILITGANSGIGLASARLFAQQGANLILERFRIILVHTHRLRRS